MQEFNRVKIVILPEGAEDRSFTGHVVFDDPGRVPHHITCVVLNTETVENIVNHQRGYGYYFLVVQKTQPTEKYERLGIGVAVAETDRIPYGYFGRKSPQTSIILI